MVDIHPRLRPKEEPVETPVETPVEEPAVETPVEAAPEAPVAEEPVRRVIDLDSEDLYQQINRYSQEDPRFSNQLNSLVGRKAAQTYQPQITRLQADLARAQQRLQELETRGLDEEELKDRLLKDENFRRTYNQRPSQTPEQIEAAGQFQAAIARAEGAVDLEPQEIDRLRAGLANGWFDAERDSSGRVIRTLSPQESVAWYSSVLHQEAAKKRQTREAPPPAAPPQAQAVVEAPVEQPPVKPQMNTRLAQLDPDLTPSAPQTGAPRMSVSEYQKLPPPQRFAMFPKTEDYEAARRQGIIYDG